MKTQLLFLSILLTVFASINAQTIMNIYQSNGTLLQIPISSIDSINYTVNNQGNLATITTLPILNITNTSATSGGSITSSSGSNVIQRGVCWSTSQNPTIANSFTNDGIGTGNFASILTSLLPNTIYFVRAYAINSAGAAYGNQESFITTNNVSVIVSNPGAGVTFNGYSYNSVVLGNGQEWMSENLQTANYRNGDPIPIGLDDATWNSANNNSSGASAIYNNDGANNAIYGKLYNWYVVADPRNVCPTGWHVPSDGEWTILKDYLGGEAVAGGKMKSTGTQYWTDPNTDATNESGFSGLPGGYRYIYGSFNSIGDYGYWWSSSEDGTGAGAHLLGYDNVAAGAFYPNKGFGLSVRCLKD